MDIPFCVLDSPGVLSTEVSMVVDHIVSEMGRAGFTFNRLETCPTDWTTRAVRYVFVRTVPKPLPGSTNNQQYSPELGEFFNGLTSIGSIKSSGVHPDASSALAIPEGFGNGTIDRKWTSWTYRNALHESAHAIGFEHEHGRTDSSEAEECRQWLGIQERLPEGVLGRTYYGDYDEFSILNYCNSRDYSRDYHEMRMYFSKNDVALMRSVYAR